MSGGPVLARAARAHARARARLCPRARACALAPAPRAIARRHAAHARARPGSEIRPWPQHGPQSVRSHCACEVCHRGMLEAICARTREGEAAHWTPQVIIPAQQAAVCRMSQRHTGQQDFARRVPKWRAMHTSCHVSQARWTWRVGEMFSPHEQARNDPSFNRVSPKLCRSPSRVARHPPGCGRRKCTINHLWATKRPTQPTSAQI